MCPYKRWPPETKGPLRRSIRVKTPATPLSVTDSVEVNSQSAFWSNNCLLLRAIDHKYRPDGCFFLHHGVGSEDWSADGFACLEVH